MSRFHCFCSVVLLSLIVGCSGGNVGLRGVVTYSDDGTPMPVGTVVFRKDGKIARGDIKEDGTYIVGFDKETNGLPPGKYEVYISGARVVVGERPSSDDSMEYIYEQLIDMKYERPETSGLSVDVNASTKVFNIEVERFKKK